MRRTAGIETARLTIRPYRPDDVDALHRLWTDPEVRRYLWDDAVIPLATAAQAVQASIDSTETHGYGHWAVCLRGTDDVIGFCGFRVLDDGPDIELLYGLAPAHWGKGLATEASRTLLSWGFSEYPWDRILAITDAPNAASIRVMERLGMSFQKRIDHHGLDTVFYVIERVNFVSTQP
jgi:ribosomal-protein-alanine N-acetyltransferase